MNMKSIIREIAEFGTSVSTKKGGIAMKTNQLKTVVLSLGLLAVGLMGLASKAHAYTDALNSNNTAQITITITPNVDRSVTITTDNVHMDMGNVNLTGSFVSTQTVRPSTVTIGGTMGNTDLLLSGNITGGWNFDASSSTLEQNKLATWVSFTSISTAVAPAQNTEYFRGEDGTGSSALLASDTADFAATRVGTDAATLPGRFENDLTSMNGLAVSTQRHMWMFFRMPSATTITDAQRVTFILTVDSGI